MLIKEIKTSIKYFLIAVILAFIFGGLILIWQYYWIEREFSKLPQKVFIITDKIEYEQGEEVKILLINSLEKDIYLSYNPLCEELLSKEIFYDIYQFSEKDWTSLLIVSPPICSGEGTTLYKKVKSRQSLEFVWDQLSWDKKLETLTQSPLGKYKVLLNYTEDKEKIKHAFSYEFVITADSKTK